MSAKKETKKRTFNWGDGHRVTVRTPKLHEVPGESMMCPVICNPVGEDEVEWKEHEQKGTRPKRAEQEDEN